MSELEHLIELLKSIDARNRQAHNPSSDETLRQLIRASVPNEEISDALWQRLANLASVVASPEPSSCNGQRTLRQRVQRLFGLHTQGRWRPVIRALPYIATILALCLVFIFDQSAGALENTLDAMSRVRTAHCRGWLFSYVDRKPDGTPIRCRMKMEWWYRAPDEFRRDIGIESRRCSTVPGVLIVSHHQGLFFSHRQHQPAIAGRFNMSELTQDLSPFDFFTPSGILGRAYRDRATEISTAYNTYQGRKVRILSVSYRRGPSRHDWILIVDAHSNMLLKSDHIWYWKKRAGWEPQTKEVLGRFEYNVKLNDSLFRRE
jgi:hypothetical protein